MKTKTNQKFRKKQLQDLTKAEITAGIAYLETFCGIFKITHVSEDYWVHTVSKDGYQRSWCCHGGTIVLIKQK